MCGDGGGGDCGVCRVGAGELSLDGPPWDGSCPSGQTGPFRISANIRICSCSHWSCRVVYGHVHAWAVRLPSKVPPIAMVSAALIRHCSRQYAAALHAASRGMVLHQQSSYVRHRLGPGHSGCPLVRIKASRSHPSLSRSPLDPRLANPALPQQQWRDGGTHHQSAHDTASHVGGSFMHAQSSSRPQHGHVSSGGSGSG